MAVIDQDNFSNISWQSETNNGAEAGQSTASMPDIGAEPPSSEDQRHGQDLEQQDPGLSGDILECTVSEPHKESDGTKDAFVSYLITTNVRMCVRNDSDSGGGGSGSGSDGGGGGACK